MRFRAGAAADLEHAAARAAARARRSADRGRAGSAFASGRRCGADAGRRGPSASRGKGVVPWRSILQDVEMEAAVDRRSGPGAEDARLSSLAIATSGRGCLDGGDPEQDRGSAAVRKMTRAPGRAVRVISAQSAFSCASSSSPARRAAHRRRSLRPASLSRCSVKERLTTADSVGARADQRRNARRGEIGRQRDRRHVLRSRAQKPARRSSFPTAECSRRAVRAADAEPTRHVAVAGKGQRLVLRGRDAETVERRHLGGRPAHEALVEERRKRRLEECPLLVERGRPRSFRAGRRRRARATRCAERR